MRFAEAVLDWVLDQVCVDPRRVFAAGYSGGARTASRMASRSTAGRRGPSRPAVQPALAARPRHPQHCGSSEPLRRRDERALGRERRGRDGRLGAIQRLRVGPDLRRDHRRGRRPDLGVRVPGRGRGSASCRTGGDSHLPPAPEYDGHPLRLLRAPLIRRTSEADRPDGGGRRGRGGRRPDGGGGGRRVRHVVDQSGDTRVLCRGARKPEDMSPIFRGCRSRPRGLPSVLRMPT